MQQCPNCRQEQRRQDARFCDFCGADLTNQERMERLQQENAARERERAAALAAERERQRQAEEYQRWETSLREEAMAAMSPKEMVQYLQLEAITRRLEGIESQLAVNNEALAALYRAETAPRFSIGQTY